MKLVRYTDNDRHSWNNFLCSSKNGNHFIFLREYMEYHSCRFDDCSLIAYNERSNIIAILPANISCGALFSHQGLTFGGFITNERMTAHVMLELFNCLISFCRSNDIHKIVYKCSPHIYHSSPSEEDLYALFRNDFHLYKRELSATIDMSQRIRYQQMRARAVKKAQANHLFFQESDDFVGFWKVLERVLESRHNSQPVHSQDEILMLSKIFPKNIRLFIAKREEKILAGAVVYETEHVAHTQYLANSEEGRNLGALDFVIDSLINHVYIRKRYIDLGRSNSSEGRVLNTRLMAQKEGFGARSVAYDHYQLRL